MFETHIKQIYSHSDIESRIIPSLQKFQQPSLLYTGPNKRLFWAVEDNCEVVLKFTANPIEAHNELRVLEDMNGLPHIVKLHESRKWDYLTLIVTEYRRPIQFRPSSADEVGAYAFQLLEVRCVFGFNT